MVVEEDAEEEENNIRKVTPKTRCRHIVEEAMTGDLLFRISADMFWSRFNCEIAI